MSKPPQDIKERAFEFALRIIKLCQHLDKKPGVPRTLSYQLLKAGTSVGPTLKRLKRARAAFPFASLLLPFCIAECASGSISLTLPRAFLSRVDSGVCRARASG